MFADSLTTFVHNHADEFITKLGEQLYLIALSSSMAIILGILIGIFAFWYKRSESFILGITGVIWTIPSLALFGLLLPWLGLGVKPALIALMLYSLLPVIQNTITGLSQIAPQLIEAANGLGMTRWQRLKLIEFPLAFPFILTGIRTAVIFNVSMSTLVAFIGAGGLGDFINRGLAISDMNLLLLGAIPVALMALLLSFLFSEKFKSFFGWVSLSLFLIFIGIFWITQPAVAGKNKIIIASKNFTEQIILAEFIAQMLEKHTHLIVVRKFNLGTADITHQALVRGDVDIYPEYTGTAYLTILHFPYQRLEKNNLYQIVKKVYQEKFHLFWLAPFGFDSTQLPAVKITYANKHHLETITDLVPLAPQLIMGAPPEFLVLPTGMPALKAHYGLQFKDVKTINLGLMYQSIAEGAAEVIFALNTDPCAFRYHLRLLQDDKHAFPPYYAAPVVREETLKNHPEIQTALQPLAGLLDEKTMRFLNGEVDIQKRLPRDVVREFLLSKKISARN